MSADPSLPLTVCPRCAGSLVYVRTWTMTLGAGHTACQIPIRILWCPACDVECTDPGTGQWSKDGVPTERPPAPKPR